MFSSSSGSYLAQYSVDNTRRSFRTSTVTPATTSARSRGRRAKRRPPAWYSARAPGALISTATAPGLGTSHSVQLTGLNPTTIYYYRVVSADGVGNSTTAPAEPDVPSQFTTTAVVCPCSIWTPDQAGASLGRRPQCRGTWPPVSDIGGRLHHWHSLLQGDLERRAARRQPVDELGHAARFSHVHERERGGLAGSRIRRADSGTANTTYVVSYHTDSGGYAADLAYFQSAGVINPPLQALANGIDGANGVLRYGPSAFPTETPSSTNYWVDVVFSTTAVDTVPPTVTSVTPGGTRVNHDHDGNHARHSAKR